jgi:hypothetical protein
MDFSVDRRELAAAGVALWLVPLAGVLLVLFTGVKEHGAIVLVALPLASAALTYLISRELSVPVGRSLLWGLGCLVSGVVCNGCALLIAALIGSWPL